MHSLAAKDSHTLWKAERVPCGMTNQCEAHTLSPPPPIPHSLRTQIEHKLEAVAAHLKITEKFAPRTTYYSLSVMRTQLPDRPERYLLKLERGSLFSVVSQLRVSAARPTEDRCGYGDGDESRNGRGRDTKCAINTTLSVHGSKKSGILGRSNWRLVMNVTSCQAVYHEGEKQK